MARLVMREDPHRFVQYYEGQVGGTLPGFYGAPVMYGRGIGSLFSKLFRFVSPMLKKGFSIAKPHLKSAVSNIASEVFNRAVGRSTNQQKQQQQEGSGGIMVLSRRLKRRPPGQRLQRDSSTSKKRTSVKRKKSVGRSRRVRRKSARSSDIF